MVVICNVIMWGCYVNSLKVLSSLQATVTNFATNFLSSGLAGFLLFKEALSAQVNDLVVANMKSVSLLVCVFGIWKLWF